nr:hypothetical protein [Paracoccus yeei]
MQPVGVRDRGDRKDLVVFRILQIPPAFRNIPALAGEPVLVVSKARGDKANADGILSHPREVIDIPLDRRFHRRGADPKRIGLIHRAIVQQHDVKLLRALLRLKPGDILGRVTRHEGDLDVMVFSNSGISSSFISVSNEPP